MVQLIVGEKGKGKIKFLLEKVNKAVTEANGNIVYIDKSMKIMHELSNKVRLINVTEFPISTSDEFVGFLCGILSQDNDLEQIYFDSFLKVAYITDNNVLPVINKLEKLSEQFHVDFTISVSINETDLPEELKSKIVVSL